MKKILLGGLLGLASLTMAPSRICRAFRLLRRRRLWLLPWQLFPQVLLQTGLLLGAVPSQIYNAFTPVICGNVNCGTGYDVLMPQACAPYYGAGAPGPYVIGGVGACRLHRVIRWPLVRILTPYGPVQSIGYYPGYGYYGVPVMPPYQPVIPIGAANLEALSVGS